MKKGMAWAVIGLALVIISFVGLCTDNRPVVTVATQTNYVFFPVELTAQQMATIRGTVTNTVNIDPAVIGHVRLITITVRTNGTARIFFQ